MGRKHKLSERIPTVLDTLEAEGAAWKRCGATHGGRDDRSACKVAASVTRREVDDTIMSDVPDELMGGEIQKAIHDVRGRCSAKGAQSDSCRTGVDFFKDGFSGRTGIHLVGIKTKRLVDCSVRCNGERLDFNVWPRKGEGYTEACIRRAKSLRQGKTCEVLRARYINGIGKIKK